MKPYGIVLCVMAATLVGCATAPAPRLPPVPLQDEAFAYNPARVTVTREDLFRLDPRLESQLHALAADGMGRNGKLRTVMKAVFGEHGFAYEAGHSTTAAETWERRTGDCLSLTVLAYAVGKALDMPATMQEVQSPAIFDRRGQIDFVNQHVNVLFLRARHEYNGETEARDVVIDFEPDFASARRGTPLTEDGVLARYYNNVAVEALAQGDRERAYAHFRAAIQAQPDFAAAYANLAVLYRNEGRAADAEALLRRALAAQPGSPTALFGLHRLLLDEGRVGEAAAVSRAIEARQAEDPYYWTGRGLQALRDGDPRGAVKAFERAKDIAAGFDELHAYLAVAYAQSGRPAQARAEIQQLAKAGGSPDKIALLKRKIGIVAQ